MNVLTGFQVDFTTFVAAWDETDRFFSQNTGKTCVRLSVPNYIFSMLKSCFTDLFYVGWIQWGSCFVYIAIWTRFKSIQSKILALYSKKRDYLILPKVSKKIKYISFSKILKKLFYLQNNCFRWMSWPVFRSILPFWWPYGLKQMDLFLKKREKRVCE